MPQFADALDIALRARYERVRGDVALPITHRRGLMARLRRIEAAAGGGRREASAAAGIPYSTWGHLVRGTRPPSERTAGRLEQAFQRLVVGPATARATRRAVRELGYPGRADVWALVVADPRGARYINRGRQTRDGRLWPPGWRQFRAEAVDPRRTVDTWLTDGPAAAATAFLGDVADAYGEEFAFEGDEAEITLVQEES